MSHATESSPLMDRRPGLPEAVTLPDCLRDQPPPRLARWAHGGDRLLLLAWTAAEWAALPVDARPLDAAPLGDMMALLVWDGPLG